MEKESVYNEGSLGKREDLEGVDEGLLSGMLFRKGIDDKINRNLLKIHY